MPEIPGDTYPEATISFNAADLEKLLGIGATARAVESIKAQFVGMCKNRVCKLDGRCDLPPGKFPGPDYPGGTPGYYAEESHKHTARFLCSIRVRCPDQSFPTQAIARVSKLIEDCGQAVSELHERQEPIIDQAEAAKDRILARANEEASAVFSKVYARVDVLRQELADPIARGLFGQDDNTQ